MADVGTTRDSEVITALPTSKRVKERRQYTEDCLQDEEIEGKRMFSVDDKLASTRFGSFFVQEMSGEDFNLKYLQMNGFEAPVVIKEKTGLGMRMPSSNFTVNDVKQCVGSRRLLDVMDVTTQKDIEMSMKDWCRYFEGTNRDKLLNVISLEFSHTKLENYVESPAVVRQVDWVDLVWPRHLKESQTEGTNVIEEMKYPKVQKYCLMSVKGCYTDFHVDFGGTSVWYHIMRGAKVFWLIPPTERNLQLYEQWVLSGKQGDIFFGDTVEKCARIHLQAGYTFFIPTGWIHAVFTPEDSLVFGGNFLHSFGMQKQIRIVEVEDVTHVPFKFRYPFYTEIMWYALQRYVYCLLGKNHLTCNENGDQLNPSEWPPDKGKIPAIIHTGGSGDPLSEEKKENILDKEQPLNGFKITSGADDSNASKLDVGGVESHLDGTTSTASANLLPKQRIHLSKVEICGLKVMLEWLQHLPPNKRNLPDLVKDAESLITDVRIVLRDHQEDDAAAAITGKPTLFWTMTPKKRPKPRPSGPPSGGGGGSKGGGKSGSKSNNNSNARRRRTRCKKCEACLRADCGDCHFCKDMKKFGGPGRMKQSCISRQCMAPVLPHTACCMLCGRDGWEKVNNPQENEVSSLMECSQCWEIVHPACLKDHNPELPLEGMASDDLPNSWECPRCLRDGKPDTVKPRYVKPSKGTPNAATSSHSSQPVTVPNTIGPPETSMPTAATAVAVAAPQPPAAHLSSSVPHIQAATSTPGVCDLSMGGTTAMAQVSVPASGPSPVTSSGRPLPNSLLLGSVLRPESKSKSPFPSQPPVLIQHRHVKEEELSDGENRAIQPIPKKIKIDRFHGCLKQESPSKWQQGQHGDPEEGEEICNKEALQGNAGVLRSSGQTPNQHHRTALRLHKRTSESSDGERDEEASLEETDQGSRLSVAHVRSCSRFSLKGDFTDMPANEISLKIPKLQSGLELRTPRLTSRPSLTALSTSKKHGETARERLFRNLKGLKKNSNELSSVRHSILRVKTKGQGDASNNNSSPRNKEQAKEFPLKTVNSVLAVKKERGVSEGNRGQPPVSMRGSLFIGGQEDSKDDPKVAGLGTPAVDKTERQENKSDSGQAQTRVPSSPNHNFNMTLRDKSNLRKPKYVVRPAPVLEETKIEKQKASSIPTDNLALEKEVILPVFHFLTPQDLLSCQLVCRSWNRWCVDPRLWTYMDLSRRKITANILMGVVRRQPLTLNLSWTNISKRQLSWLISRLPQLKDLVLSGCAAVAVSALCSSGCPLLRSLDLCWTEGLVDSIIRDLLSPPSDSRPGFVEAKTRLRQLMEVRVAGADISDVSVRLLAHHLPLLCRLDLSHCHKVTDMGIAVLGAAKAARLTHLDVSSCSNISDTSLEALKRCSNLMLLDMRECPQVADVACQKFVSHLRYSMTVKEGKFMERKS